jgi:DNA-binding beta-propeller fold protein YncE
MEQEENYRRVLAVRDELKFQLSTLHTSTKDEEVAAGIESHFSFCMNALASRKATLLQDLEVQIARKNKKIKENQKMMEGVIESCNKILNTGSHLYKTSRDTASAVWKTVNTLPEPAIVEEKIQLNFQSAFLGTIASYGTLTCVPTSTLCSAGTVSTVAGSVRGMGDGIGLQARMNGPRGVCFNPIDRCLYVCDSHNHSVRKVTPEGKTTSMVLTHYDLECSVPFGIAVYLRENCLFVTDKGYHSILKISSSGKVELYAGTGSEGKRDGARVSAQFSFPTGIAVDQRTGNLFVAEAGTNCIRMITQAGQVTTIAGSGNSGSANGLCTLAEFHYPMGLCFSDKFKCLFVCDFSNNKLRTISATGDVLTVPCEIFRPSSVAVTSNGTIIVTSLLGHKVIAINQVHGKYRSTVLAGMDIPGKHDGVAKFSSFNSPSGITLDEQNHACYVAEVENHTIRIFSLHYKYHTETKIGYKERWTEFFTLLDVNGDGFVEPNDPATWYYVTKTLAKFWRAPELSEKVHRSVEGMKYVIVSFIEAMSQNKAMLSLAELLRGVENLFVGKTPATMPIWWKESVKRFFELNDLDETGELPYTEFYASVKNAALAETDEKIYAAYQWARSLSPTGKFDSTAAMVVTFIWATSHGPEPEAVTSTPFWRRVT